MLKNILSLLLSRFYSKQESELVGHQAMPSSEPTTISSQTSISSWGTIATFTAPGDGYVTLRGRSMEAAAAQIASLPLENNPTVITATQDKYQGMSCNLPVVKGKTVEVYGSNIENIVVTFNRLVGGGYQALKNALLQGGGLCCLKHSYSSLRRSSWLAGGDGSAVKGFSQTQIPEQYSTSTPAKRKFTRHQLTVGLRLGETKHRLMLELRESWGSYALIRKDSLESLFQFVRGTLLVFTAKQQILNHLRQSLFQVKELHSVSLAGGASC